MIGPAFPRFSVDLSPNLNLPTLFRGRIGYSRVSCGELLSNLVSKGSSCSGLILV
jgi:hypothetical protein